MSRGPRVLINNVAYHIISRGNQKQTVYFEADDYRKFLEFLWKYKNKYTIKLYAYCLMGNHFHLIAEPENKLILHKMMHGLNMSYAKWFNFKYKKCGHLWQDRFKSFALQKDQYLINCITYVEFNPIRENNCRRCEEYPWSSYKARVLGDKNKLVDALIM